MRDSPENEGITEKPPAQQTEQTEKPPAQQAVKDNVSRTIQGKPLSQGDKEDLIRNSFAMGRANQPGHILPSSAAENRDSSGSITEIGKTKRSPSRAQRKQMSIESTGTYSDLGDASEKRRSAGKTKPEYRSGGKSERIRKSSSPESPSARRRPQSVYEPSMKANRNHMRDHSLEAERSQSQSPRQIQKVKAASQGTKSPREQRGKRFGKMNSFEEAESPKGRATRGGSTGSPSPPRNRASSGQERTSQRKGSRQSVLTATTFASSRNSKFKLGKSRTVGSTLGRKSRMSILSHGVLTSEDAVPEDEIEEESRPILVEEWMYELPIFANCSRDFVDTVLEKHTRMIFQPNQHIVNYGDEGSSMYIIIFGFAEVLAAGKDIVGTGLTAGDCVGEMMALGVSEKRTATVRASSVCGVMEISKNVFSSALEKFAEERKRFVEMARVRKDALCRPASTIMRNCPFFEGFSDRLLFLLGQETESRLIHSGDVLVNEGDNFGELLILVDGMLSLGIAGREVRHLVVGNHNLPGISPDRSLQLAQLVGSKSAHSTDNASAGSAPGSPSTQHRGSISSEGRQRRGNRNSVSDSPEAKLPLKEVAEEEPSKNDTMCAFIGELQCMGIRKDSPFTIRALSSCDLRVLTSSSVHKVMQAATIHDRTRYNDLMGMHLKQPLIKNVTCFQDCSHAFLMFLTAHLDERMYSKGIKLVDGIHDGLDGKSMFCVVHGMMKGDTFRLDHKPHFDLSQKHSQDQLALGEFYGSFSALGVSTQTVSNVETVTISFVRVLRQSILLKALGECPSDRPKLLESVRLKMNTEIAEELGPTNEDMDIALASMKKAPLFQGTELEVVQHVASRSEQCVFLPGDVILMQDTSGDTMYILADGSVDIYVKTERASASGEGRTNTSRRRSTNLGGFEARRSLWSEDANLGLPGAKDEQFLRTLGPGATFGEMAVLGISRVRLATVRAKSLCLAWVIERKVVLEMLQHYPKEKQKFVELVNVNLERSVTKRMASLSLLEDMDRKFAVVLGLHCERRVYFPNQVLMKEGRPAENLMVINVGTVAIEMKGERITTLHVGHHFGAAAMLGLDKVYFVTLTATVVSHILVVSKSCFNFAVEKYPEMLEAIKALKVDVFQKKERMHAMYKRTFTRKRLMRRMETVHQTSMHKEEKYDENSATLLKRVYSAWHDYAHHLVEAKRHRAAEMAITARRMDEYLTRKDEQMAKVAPARELKALVHRNINSRGPLETIPPPSPTRSPTTSRPPTNMSLGPELDVEMSVTMTQTVREEWPKPRLDGYDLKLWKILDELPLASTTSVLSRYSTTPGPGRDSRLEDSRVGSTYDSKQLPSVRLPSPEGSRAQAGSPQYMPMRPNSCPPGATPVRRGRNIR